MNPHCFYFLSLSCCHWAPDIDTIIGNAWQNSINKTLLFWLEDQEGGPSNCKVLGNLQKGGSSGKWLYKIVQELLGVNLILNDIPKIYHTNINK